jgi:hypothetical protein
MAEEQAILSGVKEHVIATILKAVKNVVSYGTQGAKPIMLLQLAIFVLHNAPQV